MHKIWTQKMQTESLAPSFPRYVAQGNQFELSMFYQIPHAFINFHSCNQTEMLTVRSLEPDFLWHLLTMYTGYLVSLCLSL
jgi:hypothetical protein